MDLASFLAAAAHEVAELVHSKGPRVVVLPVNGTRRWFTLENAGEKSGGDFLHVILERYRALFTLLFSHGISTILTPVLGPDIVQRGNSYNRMVSQALEEITGGADFESFYQQFDVCVRFYGDYEDYFKEASPDFLPAARQVELRTRDRLGHKLFWGMFAHDPVEWIAAEAVAFQLEHGRLPQRTELIARYYGEFLPPTDMFIGMQPPAVFDYPLLDTGRTALYFTTAPTPYLDASTLRRILHDYLFVRPVPESYESVPQDAWDELRTYYHLHAGEVAGVGKRSSGGHFWLPAGSGSDHP